MTYTLTDEATGALIHTYRPEAYPAGETGARKAATIAARRYAWKTGPCLLTGPTGFPVRRYAEEYARRQYGQSFPYRVRGACGHWCFPLTKRGPAVVCRECWKPSATQREAVGAANRRRRREPAG